MKQTVTPESPASRLLDDYRPGSSFFMASAKRTMLAQGIRAEVPCPGGPDGLRRLPGEVAATLQRSKASETDNPLAVGEVPFDRESPARLIVPETVRQAGPLPADPDAPAERTTSSVANVEPIPGPAEYRRGVERALDRIRSGRSSKIVLARTLQLLAESAVDIRALLRNLVRRNAHGYTFAVDLPLRGTANDGLSSAVPTLVGASPELLVSRSGMRAVSNPLAGSLPRGGDPSEDARRAAALLASAKDRREHALVVEAVAAALKPFCVRLDVPTEPSLVHTATMWHLSTVVRGELADPSISSLELAAALHPTPAVCGSPTEPARDAIRDIEPFDRGFYAGAVGWCDAAGDGEWAVAIRCAEVRDRRLRLFAGAGIVAGSDAEAELAETSAKFRTMLRAMGLDDDDVWS
ncbi:isochorismate synthase DhbC [Paenibacillus sp. GYB003]|uniref:isochorismate synthase DhbC n=1 Tax=Paenibacillus sp. GYB003 TaxID=2994392 RepID=UPI002F9653B3